MSDAPLRTEVVVSSDRAVVKAPRVALRVVAGPDSGKEAVLALDRLSVGTHASNTLVLTDRSVSRFHFEIGFDPRGLVITDLGSTNGTFVSGLRIQSAFAGPGAVIRAGLTALEVSAPAEPSDVPIYPEASLGRLVGTSVAMRRLFATLLRVAATDVPVLLLGETGTGKEVVAREIHAQSERRNGPFVVVDCGAIPPELAESELFGHVKGAFTGAASDRRGAFEAADNGTLFLDEIGELEPTLQPRLLRAVEAKQVKRVGSDQYRSVDVRVVAATHRDLRVAVNEGSFREDLFYRIAVAVLRVPALRERPDDVPVLLSHFYGETAQSFGLAPAPPSVTPETLARLQSMPWRGNCRELRNFVERSLALSGDLRADGLHLESSRAAPGARDGGPEIRGDLPYKEAKGLWVDHFEREYVTSRLRQAEGNISRASREMEIDRAYLLRLLKKHGIR